MVKLLCNSTIVCPDRRCHSHNLNFVIVLRPSSGHPEPMEGDQIESNSKEASQFHGAFASCS